MRHIENIIAVISALLIIGLPLVYFTPVARFLINQGMPDGTGTVAFVYILLMCPGILFALTFRPKRKRRKR